MARVEHERVALCDPATGRPVEALRLHRAGGIDLIAIPSRALDVYCLNYDDVGISYTDSRAGIAQENFVEDGAAGFSANFFAGMLTTCGLIQSGRPCEEAGRRFGLHGRISNTPAAQLTVIREDDRVTLEATMMEAHPEGERMELRRRLTLSGDDVLLIEDTVTNRGNACTPFMMMYHVNFGAPFLSEVLEISLPFTYIENRDTGCADPEDTVRRILPEGARDRETVYYTRADIAAGAKLFNPVLGIECMLSAEGEGLDWVGVWQNFVSNRYALGIEPCNCPGLGRVGAADRGILPYLAPGDIRTHRLRLSLRRKQEEELR